MVECDVQTDDDEVEDIDEHDANEVCVHIEALRWLLVIDEYDDHDYVAIYHELQNIIEVDEVVGLVVGHYEIADDELDDAIELSEVMLLVIEVDDEEVDIRLRVIVVWLDEMVVNEYLLLDTHVLVDIILHDDVNIYVVDTVFIASLQAELYV